MPKYYFIIELGTVQNFTSIFKKVKIRLSKENKNHSIFIKRVIYMYTHTESSKYYARMQTADARGLALPTGRLAGQQTDAASEHSLCYFSLFSEYMVTCIDVHLQSGNISVYWLWILLYVSAVSVVIVIIAICDMPRQEFSLFERVYIHSTGT